MKTKQTFTVIGRRWFDRINGNTYHSAEAFVNGKLIGRVAFEYGYGDQWQWTAAEILEKAGYMPKREKFESTGGSESLWRYCEKHNIDLVSTCSDVQRKKDL